VEGILAKLLCLVVASSMAVLPLELKVGLPYLRRYPVVVSSLIDSLVVAHSLVPPKDAEVIFP